MVRFEKKLFGKDTLPTAAEMKEFPYVDRGWFWLTHQLVVGVDEQGLYDRGLSKAFYERHNRDVIAYFASKPGQLLGQRR
jgi:hypothetical protein